MNLHGARADRITAVVFFALGLAMAIGGYTMDRLEFRDIHPASIPGLLPMILGAIMMLCAVLLFLTAKDEAPLGPVVEGEADETVGSSVPDLLFAAGYSTAYALVLVGNMPFAVATAIYITVFVFHFTWDGARDRRGHAVAAAKAAVFAVICAAAISALFRYAFLVRLP